MTEDMLEATVWEELDLAVTCKAEGQHGKARVLARRAVGMASQMLLKSLDRCRPGLSALDSISELRRSNFAKPAWEPFLSHFLLHVDEDHNMPGGVDLVDEAAYLISELTKMTKKRSRINEKD